MSRHAAYRWILFGALSCFAAASRVVAADALVTRKLLAGSTSGETLSADTIYEVGNGYAGQETITYSQSAGNGLTINHGGVTAICIPKNKTLVVKGSGTSGSRQSGGKAGIYVPSGTTLVIFGDGTLQATGAPAGSGEQGKGGGNGRVAWGATMKDSDCHGYGGAGGAGGYGGGGSAPAIGGNGGSGGDGGSGGQQPSNRSTCTSDRGNFNHSGNDGGGGSEGTAGDSGGQVYILGNVTLSFSGMGSKDTSAASGGGGGSGSSCKLQGGTGKPGTTFGYGQYYVGGGGGGGGGGSGSFMGYFIGGGGGGGGGGAGGGSGGGTYWERVKIRGDGGSGGQCSDSSSGVNGSTGTNGEGDKSCKCDGTTYSGGGTGTPGSAGANGGATAVNIASNVMCNVSNLASSKLPAETYYRLKFHFLLEQGDKTFTAGDDILYGDCPKNLYALPMREGCEFLGYYTASGERCYNSDGTAVPKPYFYINNETLYARFVESSNFERTGVEINGRDVAYESGAGWEWKTNDFCATLSPVGGGVTTHRLSGTNLDSRVCFKTHGDMTLLFDHLCISNTSAKLNTLLDIAVSNRVACKMSGVNTLWRTADYASGAGSVVTVEKYATLTVTNDADTAGGYLTLRRTPANQCVVNIGNSATLDVGGGRLRIYGGGTSAATASVTGTEGTFRLTGGTTRIENANASGVEINVKHFPVSGGSLHLLKSEKPTIASGDSGGNYRCITSAVPGSRGDDWRVEITAMGKNNVTNTVPYGSAEIYPEQGFVYLWQPDGHVTFDVDGMHAWVEHDSGKTDALFADITLCIDDRRVGTALGTGWAWMPTTSNLTFTIPGGTRVMTGSETEGRVHPVVDMNTTLKMEDVTFYGYGVKDGIFEVADDTTFNLVAQGAQTTIRGCDHFRGCGVSVASKGNLVISAERGAKLSVTAGAYGAGLGGNAAQPGNITIKNGAQVTVTGGFEGAGLGGASGIDGGNVTVESGATVKATGGVGAPGIGAGAWGVQRGTLTLNGSVTATGGHYAGDRGDGNVDSAPGAATAETASGTVLVVDSTADTLGGSGTTLRTALARIAAGNVAGSYVRITFAEALAGQTIRLGKRLVTGGSAANVVIEGRGLITLAPTAAYQASPNDGGGAILHQAAGTLTLSGITFAEFSTAGSGGAVYAVQPLTVSNCFFRACQAGYYGGAIYAGREGTLRIQASRFSCNVANAAGGAVFARGAVTACASSFDYNYGAFGAGAVGTYCDWSRTVAEHCSFLNNICGERGAGLDVPVGSAVAAACTFTGNTGGALYAGRELYAVSTLSTGNGRYLADVHPDAEPGIHAELFRAHICTFGSVPPGTFTGTVQTNVTAAKVFKASTNETCRLGGVDQIYRALTHRNKAIVQGCYAWQSTGWSACGGSTRLGGTKTVLYGSQAPDIVLTVDQLGQRISNERLLVGAVLASAESESLCVDTLDDVEDVEDERVSLREALRYAGSVDMASRASDGYREITFSEALAGAGAEIVISPTRGTFKVSGGVTAAVNGGNDDRRVILLQPSGSGKPLFEVADGNGLALENVTLRARGNGPIVTAACDFSARLSCFDGEDAHAVCVKQTAGSAWFERCTFTRLAGSASTLAVEIGDNAVGHAVGCTVQGCVAKGSANVFTVSSKGVFDFLNCTLSGNSAESGYLINSAADKGTVIANCALLGNTRSGGAAGKDGYAKSITLLYTTYGDLAYGTCSDPYATSKQDASVAKAFFGGVSTRWRHGVEHRYFRAKRDGTLYGNGAYVFHDALWMNLAAGLYSNGLSRREMRGSAGSAVWCVLTDQLERDIVQGYVARGAYATCCDEEYFDPGVIEVNTTTDFTRHEVAHDYDGLITLREAVEFACAQPSCRDAKGDCTIRFADAFFGALHGSQTKLARLYIPVSEGFTTGALRIEGRTDRFTAVDGAGAHRIFYVAPSNRLVVTSLTFTNAVGETAGNQPTAGGAVLNMGTAFFTNCVFRGCTAGGSADPARLRGNAAGGAVFTAEGGRTFLHQCTFSGNTALYGGALFTDAAGLSVAGSCTFAGNRAVEGWSVTEPYGGAVGSAATDAVTMLVNCTVTGNASAGAGGGVYCRGGDDGYVTLYVISSVIVGNEATNGAGDLGGFGPARLYHTAYGARAGTVDARWVETACVGGVLPNAVLAGTTPSVFSVKGVQQDIYPLLKGADVVTPVFTRADADWVNVLCAASVTATATTTVRGNRNYARRGAWCRAEQLGNEPSGPFLGATATSQAMALLALSAGPTYAYASFESALASALPGDTVTVVEEEPLPSSLALVKGVRLKVACSDAATSARVLAAASSGAAAYAASRPWYSVETVGDVVTLKLNAAATPTWGAEATDTDLVGDADWVSVLPGNVKPGLWYGLGRSASPVGPFEVAAEAWVEADEDGNLPEALVAPKVGACGFYRIRVTDNPEAAP